MQNHRRKSYFLIVIAFILVFVLSHSAVCLSKETLVTDLTIEGKILSDGRYPVANGTAFFVRDGEQLASSPIAEDGSYAVHVEQFKRVANSTFGIQFRPNRSVLSMYYTFSHKLTNFGQQQLGRGFTYSVGELKWPTGACIRVKLEKPSTKSTDLYPTSVILCIQKEDEQQMLPIMADDQVFVGVPTDIAMQVSLFLRGAGGIVRSERYHEPGAIESVTVPLVPMDMEELGPDYIGADLTDATNLDRYKILGGTWDTNTKWPLSLSLVVDPVKVLQWGKGPGLGVKELHEAGITGKGVVVATLDTPINTRHLEFQSGTHRQVDIYMNPVSDVTAEFHGMAVAGVLAGKHTGVAPDSIHYHFARESIDQGQVAKALRTIIKYNSTRPLQERIRVVSISAGPDPSKMNAGAYREARDEAHEAGIFVIDADWHGEGSGGWGMVASEYTSDRESPFSYKESWGPYNSLLVPCGGVTLPNESQDDAYTYYGMGGTSWGIPYAAGVIALGLQVDPNLTIKQVKQYLWETATYVNYSRLINPKGFIDKVLASKAWRHRMIAEN